MKVVAHENEGVNFDIETDMKKIKMPSHHIPNKIFVQRKPIAINASSGDVVWKISVINKKRTRHVSLRSKN
ncbi:hypothetical protein AZI86_09410 [Bdellovibrio bacteriovorus]|uniref:Uncharacterized protein n=1 Tax=Bdellovibrio bacteriovorus TaxID=959 RepID=A0A150WRR8_BDEBC|nr:hypothetical protein AZI86_09410 [Bdellovibrio bacteriovorus]